MREIKSEILQEKYYEINHKSGLKIYVMPKENYSSSYAVFGTNYGSIDTKFKLEGEKDFTTVPEGIAHFLEHKLFESEELDAFEQYAKTGASANAYTSFDKTCYLFSCSNNFKDNLKILLNFVQNPYFTAETVKKEQGIIGQEIAMYYDVPGWMSMFNLLRALYHNHPVKIDIAGTKESISKITDKLLYSCYNTFYNLSNMALAVVGNVDVNEVVSICDECLKYSEPIKIERAFDEEPKDIVQPYVEYKLDVSMSVFSFGFKEECKTAKRSLRDMIETNILLEIIAGETSPLYNKLLEEGVINESFSKEYFTGNGFEAVLFEGESNNPEKVSECIKEEIKNLRQSGIDASRFETVRRSLYGREIMEYNDIDGVANSMIYCSFNGYELFDSLEIYKEITVSDIEKRLQNMMKEEYSALSVVKA